MGKGEIKYVTGVVEESLNRKLWRQQNVTFLKSCALTGGKALPAFILCIFQVM